MDDVLRALLDGKISLDEAKKELELRLYGSYGHTIDTGREHRTGIPEVVIAEGKKENHLKEVSLHFIERKGKVLVSRLSKDMACALVGFLGEKVPDLDYEIEEDAGFLSAWSGERKIPQSDGRIGILTAGTSDIPIAKEAEMVVKELGCEVMAYHDVGVAGVHRVMVPLKELKDWDADVIIVAAGREGALPTLVSGLIDIPVIGLPISTGYGLHGKGETALFAMLQSCSPLVVVNIDAGFVAGAVAARIANHRRERISSE
jgi:NCAIR mutase (PurE)-related protein